MPQVQFDNSVFNVKPVALESPQNALANALTLAGERQKYEANAFALDNSRQEAARANQLAQILGRSGFNPQSPEGQAEMFRVGGVAGAQKAMKGAADIDKVKADAAKSAVDKEKLEIENHFKRFELAGQLMGGVKDQASYDQMKAIAAQIPQIAPAVQNMPAVYDPEGIAAAKAKAMSEKDRLEARHKELTLAETGRHNLSTEKISVDNNIRTNDTSRANNQATVGATMRGQNMTDARSRESNAASVSKPFEVTGEDGKPVLVRQDKAGNISRVEGYLPKSTTDKPMTDAQSKAALFGSRMQDSDRIINDLAKTGTNNGIPFSNAGFGVGNTITALGGAKNQQLQQAKRDFVNATLRRESGAVISPSEFDNAEKQYFPQIGDSEVVIAQKARNRAIATRGVQAEIPKAQRGVVSDIIGGGGSKNIDDLLNKYK